MRERGLFVTRQKRKESQKISRLCLIYSHTSTFFIILFLVTCQALYNGKPEMYQFNSPPMQRVSINPQITSESSILFHLLAHSNQLVNRVLKEFYIHIPPQIYKVFHHLNTKNQLLFILKLNSAAQEATHTQVVTA